MDILLRELRDGQGGITTSRDTELAAKDVSIGCASDQQIQLLGKAVGPRHAVIHGGRQPSLACLGAWRAVVNEKMVRSSRLDLGDRIEIGGHQLTIFAPPPGFDLAIEIRPNSRISSSDFESAFQTDLQQTWIGKRRVAWLLMAVIVAFGFVIPFLAVRPQRGGLAVATLGRVQHPASALWSSGPLAPGHQQLIGQRCAQCHQTLFSPVPDGACQSCHKTSFDHVQGSQLAKTSLGPTGRCASCHREHEEQSGFLVDRSDRNCVACHAHPEATFGSLKVQAVSGFGAGRHPPFGANPLPQQAAADRSGLKFSHTLHLDGVRVRKNDRNLLACGDCHKPSADGQHFDLPTMAANCVGCHELAFDPDAPDRQLPHGKPKDVVRMLQDYFVHKLSDPNGAQGKPREQRRLPGHEDDDSENCKGSPFVCGMQMAAKEVQIEFERRGCISCHQVKDTRDKDLANRFAVEPIHLAHDSFPAARFPHRTHLVQNGVGGDAACLSCHAADNAQSGDLRLPELPTCEKCHTDTPSRDRTRLQCVNCHSYHPHL